MKKAIKIALERSHCDVEKSNFWNGTIYEWSFVLSIISGCSLNSAMVVEQSFVNLMK